MARSDWTDGAGRRDRARSPVSSRDRDRNLDAQSSPPRRRKSVIRSPSEEHCDERQDGLRHRRRDIRREELDGGGVDRDRDKRMHFEVSDRSQVGSIHMTHSVGHVDSGGRDERRREDKSMGRDPSSSDDDRSSSEEDEVVEPGAKVERSVKPERNRRHESSDSSEDGTEEESKKSRSRKRMKSRRKHVDSSEDESEDDEIMGGTPTKKSRSRQREKSRKHGDRKSSRRKHRRNRSDSSDDDPSESDETSSSSSDISEIKDDAPREKERKRKKKRRRKEKEREQEKEIRRKEKRMLKEMKEKKTKSEKKKKKRELRAKQPITTSWGKYGILKDIDMWNKRPEFSAWLAQVKKVNMEVLSNWEEKQMFKEYMEDYNTATFPSKKYYNLDIYHRRKAMKARMKGMAKFVKVERTDFNDEEQRRLELRKEREQKKEEDVEALMRTMQSGMAQAMREQAQLREEMQYQFRLGNVEAAQAIQRRLDPDADKLAKM
ncbi:hypothetical protein MPTK1_2g12310 [Marchantia polymorpha subsp. ruderalis]|uniref:Uncharacterized protein n=1 Tax=Marchantia polymorpha TaxID=3197 RepID=A0A2R6XAZ4_MARPO|nr:hypothetical protein MARPO_0026s0140 [Marchantia polymorpha]BBN02044.1 hypothetical protein Mp_2g12310 [Marchantia polymorpha subsp. ruderalis]|eukprot:PTQ43277.1 hypothetical protein MARPO_0026s0140 [Marchantia polymorpha]